MKKIIALTLALLMLGSALPMQALAAQKNTPKEEVVYVNLNADGSMSQINVVNIFNLAENGTIVDYGDYESLRNMTTTDPINYNDKTVTIQANAGKLYYEGKLKNPVLPWKIAIRYYLDGNELSAQEVAGKSGALKITVDIDRNGTAGSNFFDSFALQVVLTLDTAKCRSITASSATIANVGSNKQMTHTILPGKGAHLEVTADVENFSMEGISINAIPLNLNVEVDDEALKEQMGVLVDAITTLHNGAESLKNGISELKKGTEKELAAGVDDLTAGTNALEAGVAELKKGGSTLQSGALELKDGASALNTGIQTLNDGIEQVQTALNELNKQSSTLNKGSATFLSALTQLQTTLNSVAVTNQTLTALSDASAQILDGITKLAEGAQAVQQNVSFAALKSIMAERGLDVDSLRQNNSNAMATLRATIDENREMADLLGFGDMFNSLEQVILLLSANNAFIDGTGAYLNAVNQNTIELVSGAQQLQASYNQFNDAIAKLVNGMGSLAESMGQLTAAVNTLVSEYQKLHGGIGSYTGAVAEISAGYAQIVSGAALLAANSTQLTNGAAALHTGAGELLAGITDLHTGAETLNTGAGKLDKGVADLLKGITQLFDGSSALEEGTSNMRDESSGFDDVISDKVDDILSGITGGDFELGSFVSEENTQVESVQFVIKTAGVAASNDAINDQADEQQLTFWQKLLKLFGF